MKESDNQHSTHDDPSNKPTAYARDLIPWAITSEQILEVTENVLREQKDVNTIAKSILHQVFPSLVDE